MKHKIIVKEITVKKPGTKTGKIYLKLGLPENLILKSVNKLLTKEE